MKIISWCGCRDILSIMKKNDPMQAYMIDRSENKSIEETEHVPDRAVIDFRRTAREKKKRDNGSGEKQRRRRNIRCEIAGWQEPVVRLRCLRWDCPI